MKKVFKTAIAAMLVMAMVLSFTGCFSSSTTDLDSDSSSSKVVPTITEAVIFEENDVKITATEYVSDDLWGDGVKLLIENNSSTDVVVGCEELIINGYMFTGLLAETVTAGNKANATLDIYSDELEAAGIDTVGEIEAYLYLYDSNTYENITDPILCTIQTSEYANMDTTNDITGIELYNGNDIKIIGMSVDEDSFWGTAVVLYIENNSDKDIVVGCDSASINGFMIDEVCYCTVYSGKKAIDSIEFFESDLEENGITDIETIQVDLYGYEKDSWSGNIFETGPVDITVN